MIANKDEALKGIENGTISLADIEMELRIYQNDDIEIKQVEHEPNFDELGALCKLLNE